jgi:FAD/FMN-containing dehydrogenase
METLEATTLSNGKTALSEDAVRTFAEHLRGELLRPGDGGYEEARLIWNGMIDRRPVLIARCSGTADVMDAVTFAREHELLLAVRGGGHNIAGNAVCDGGLVIDLSEMRAVHVDPAARTARVQGGATGGDLDRETQAFGLATPGGIISTTGVAGLTLGGGFGWLSRPYGLAADNLLSADVVLADGSFVTASPREHVDLFWALRGGGGNFGVVTSFEFRLHEVGPEVLFGPTVYRLEDAPAVLQHVRAFVREAPRACSVYLDLLTAPPFPFLPVEAHGTKVLSVIQFYAGNVEEGEAVLRPLREYGDPLADAVAPMPYTTAQSISDDLYAKGARNYWKSHNLTALSNGFVDALVACAEELPTPQSDILIHHLGGVINEVAPEATAYPHRDTAFVVTPGGRWKDPADDERCIAWTRDCYDALAEHASGGTYMNFLSEREGGEQNAYGSNYERLARIKARYDPDNRFRMNQNVHPMS